jgi:hypothetical protein
MDCFAAKGRLAMTGFSVGGRLAMTGVGVWGGWYGGVWRLAGQAGGLAVLFFWLFPLRRGRLSCRGT